MQKLAPSIAWLVLLLGSWLSAGYALAQMPQLPLTTLPLNNLSAFQSAPSHWNIVGSVEMNLNEHLSVKTKSGQDILINTTTDRDPLRTSFEAGDILVQLDFMLPKGGQSAVYLQGRYAILLNDSWGHVKPTATDCGALEGQAGIGGIVPRQNVCRAPGLWQTLTVDFQAPRFNEQGRKISNARFLKVMLNGIILHENIEVMGPSQGSLFPDEKATGPLAVGGKPSPVAFRNIQYERYETQPVKLSNVQYQLFEGKFKTIDDIKGKAAVKQAAADGITWEVGTGSGEYALAFTGNLTVPRNGKYAFAVQCNGAAQLSIDGKTIIEHKGENGRGEIASGITELAAGDHAFAVTYAKNHWRPSVFGVFVSGQGVKPMALHLNRSFPDVQPVGAIVVEPTTEPTLLRSFMLFGDRKRTHCLSVGDPLGTHYAVDLNQGALLQIWKGSFLNTTEMWYERGEPQLAVPSGSVVPLTGQFPLARLQDGRANWPDSLDWEKELIYKGYTINPQGRPIFRYTYEGVGVSDEIKPESNGRELSRTLQVAGLADKNLFCRLAAGKTLSAVGNGLYEVNDHAYLIRVDEKKMGKPSIRKVDGRQELLLPVKKGSQTVAYSIIW